MNTRLNDTGASLETQRKYRDNFARHILSVTLHLQSEIMNALDLKHGHSQLRINFEPYIAIAAEQGARLSDIATMLGISRQAANQTANQIEAAGYLKRAADPSDGRAKLLVPTPRARALIKQGAAEAKKHQARFAEIVGDEQLAEANRHIIELNRSLGLLFTSQDTSHLPLAAVLPRLADYLSSRLQALTMARGHIHLKRSFGTVLTSIGPSGGRIQHIADAHDVSKQAISAVAGELEELGYIKRVSDHKDARQQLLLFTEAGNKLIFDSVCSLDDLETEFSKLIGESAVAQIQDVMARIYGTLHLEDDIFGNSDSSDIRVMARQINRQLGDEGAKALARLLLSGDSDY